AGRSLRPSRPVVPAKRHPPIYAPTRMVRPLSITPTPTDLIAKIALLRFGRKRTLLATNSNQSNPSRFVPLDPPHPGKLSHSRLEIQTLTPELRQPPRRG